MATTLWQAESRVNVTTPGFQSLPDIAQLRDGGFVITWVDSANNGDIKLRVYNADGQPRTGELSVPASDAATQTAPTVAALDGGGFLVSWSEGGDLNSRVFTAGGVGSAAITTEPSARNAESFTVNGGVALVYEDTRSEIATTWYAGDGTLLKARSTVNFTQFNNQISPDGTRLADGRIAVTWLTPNAEVRGRILNPDGSFQAFSDFLVNSTPVISGTGKPHVTGLSNGGFVVTWEQLTGDASVADVRARLFNSAGAPQGDDFIVNTRTADAQYYGDVVGLNDGGFLVVWFDIATASIESQRYDSSGLRNENQFRVSTLGANATSVNDLAAVRLADGRVAVTWRASGVLGDGDATTVVSILDPRDGLIFGTAADETIYGGRTGDRIAGFAGSDVILALEGDDVVDGGEAGDFLLGGAGADRIQGGEGVDLLGGEDGDDTLNGGADGDNLYGGGGFDVITGDGGDDFIDGGDTGDYLVGGLGADRVQGGAGVDFLAGEAGDDRLNGGLDGDNLFGGAGVDELFGELGNDFVGGQDGDDVIGGGAGSDQLNGGAGNDRFLFFGGDSVIGASDRIQDFASGFDRIDLSFIDANVTQAGDQAFFFRGVQNAPGGVGTAHIGFIQGVGIFLFGYTDADGTADVIIDVGSFGITAGDLIL